MWYPMMQIIIGYYLADFISGLGHWIEDTYFDENTPYIGNIAIDNIIHHRNPLRMLQYGFIDTVLTTLILLTPIYVLLLLAFGNLLIIHIFILITAMVNQIHKWSHVPQRDLPAIVKLLQRRGLILPPGNHKAHHVSFLTNYCAIHGQLNWFYDRVGLWRCLERTLACAGVFPKKRRNMRTCTRVPTHTHMHPHTHQQ